MCESCNEKKDYSSTLNLPKTDFDMKANLPKMEPNMLKFWDDNKIYEKSIDGKAKQFILHRSPPSSLQRD